MPGPFHFKQFSIHQDRCAMKVSEIACLFGAWVPAASEVKRILDIGSGTGLLGLMLAQRTLAHIDCVELDTEASLQSKENIRASPFTDRITVFEQDILTYTSAYKYDLIVCNPPFFENQLPAREPKKNLAWHASALRLTDLLACSTTLLSTTGTLGLVLPIQREEACIAMASQAGLFLHKALHVRHSGEHPVRHGFFQFGWVNHPVDSKELLIHEGTAYSSACRKLLKPFYLKL